jgi:hypothetical protein
MRSWNFFARVENNRAAGLNASRTQLPKAKPGAWVVCRLGRNGPQVIAQVVRRSSICRITRGRIIGAHASTNKTVWKTMRQDSRSKSGRRMLTHHGHLWLWSSTQVNYVPLVSSSRKCFPSSTWGSCTWWLADTRSGTAKSWGHGP